MRRLHPYFLHVILPLSLGAGIYLAFRTTSLLVFRWMQAIRLIGYVFRMRTALLPWKASMPSWILFSLPDGLWVYSFTSYMTLIWQGNARAERTFWIPLGVMLAIGGEFGQLFGFVPGRFDVKDLICYIIAFLVPLIVIQSSERGARC